ncbi:DNA-binding NarL/FixJ family response regulator [Natronospira proteinivora]|uniref:DNA-binding NarL/FixJ family response regulator n=1 Tax=Natronospira proteinivora TaxID=1807133 RepID=A0ABT1G7D7_9GAMM|nr:response regulator transcription factor [Natronospira proteinivora]MCP1727219.1 DNA-binding NarL/FixJ family response regulator [Natronospira proteinivora]
MPRVLIADDHPLFRAALSQALAQCLPDAELIEAQDLAQTHDCLTRHPDTDLVMLDLRMPGSQGLAGLAAIRCEYPSVAVVVVSGNEHPQVIRRALDHGAAGFIPKSAGLEELTEAIDAIMNCREWIPPGLEEAVASEHGGDEDLAARIASLTPQQFRVLQMVADGYLNKQIADRLSIQERTVKAHMSDIFQKLAVRNRTQAGVAFRQLSIDQGGEERRETEAAD